MTRVVLLGGDGDTTRIVAHHLAANVSLDAALIERGVPRARLLRNRAKKIGWRATIGQAAFMGVVLPVLRSTSRARIAAIKRSHRMDDGPIPGAIRIDSANSKATIERLRELAPEVVVVSGTRILSRELLQAVGAVFINWHAGITPLYRGVHGGYWSLYEGRPAECGVTVHLVDAGIDTGGVIAQATISPTAADDFVTYPYLQLAAALPLIARAVQDALDGRIETVRPPEGQSRLYYHPTILQYCWHRIARGVR